MKSFVTILVLWVCFCASALAQSEVSSEALRNYQTPGSILHTINSKIINQAYELAIALPADYVENATKKYPVVYVMDAQWNFGIISSIAGKLKYDKHMPDVIIVGVTWVGDAGALRARDFTPSAVSRLPNSGGAKKFLKVLETELISYVDAHYRTNGERVITGTSLGGLFVSYAFLERPGLFNQYVALASSFQIMPQIFVEEKLKQLAAGNLPSNTRIYIGCGLLDGCAKSSEKFSKQLQQLKLPNLEVKLALVEGLGHAGIEPIGYTYGLQLAFKP